MYVQTKVVCSNLSQAGKKIVQKTFSPQISPQKKKKIHQILSQVLVGSQKYRRMLKEFTFWMIIISATTQN
jgi:hypothetical protein